MTTKTQKVEMWQKCFVITKSIPYIINISNLKPKLTTKTFVVTTTTVVTPSIITIAEKPYLKQKQKKPPNWYLTLIHVIQQWLDTPNTLPFVSAVLKLTNIRGIQAQNQF